jgi:hypothetical protein
VYPRNAASPERISIGPVVQISDGAVQTAGVTVRILPFGGSEADGVGTVAYSTDGVVVYTPTQAETNYTSFVLIAKKTGCIPANVTVVTSESTVSGRVYVATNGDKTGYTATVSDKAGFKLASDGLALVTAWTVGITGNITGNLSGSVGSVTGAVGSVTSYGTLVNDVAAAVWLAGTRTLTGFGTLVGDVATAVWGAASRTLTAFGFNVNLTPTTGMGNQSGTIGGISGVSFPANFGSMVINSTTGHTAAVVHSVQAGAYTSAAFAANWLTASGLASDAVAEIVAGVWDEATSGHTTAGTTGKALIDSGAAGNPWSTDLSTGYSGTQAGNVLNAVKTKTDTITTPTINVYPVAASTPDRVSGTTLTFYRDETRSVSILTDFTLTSMVLRFVVEDNRGNDVYTLADGSISRSSQTATVAVTTAVTGSLGQYAWSLRDITGGLNSVVARGVLSVQLAASS